MDTMTQRPQLDFTRFVDKLTRLKRERELAFRLEVGRLVLLQFFEGDIDAYRSHDSKKPHRFRDFIDAERPALVDLGLGEKVLRNCVVVFGIVNHLPERARERLMFSHLVELAAVADAATRTRLALESIQNRWSVVALRKMTHSALGQTATDAATPEPDEVETHGELVGPNTRPGHLVNRLGRAVTDLGDLTAQWERVAARGVTEAHRERLRASVEA
jgi:hypothetical protein